MNREAGHTLGVWTIAGLTLVATSAGTAEAPGPLARTEWRLLEFQSMDDAQGTTRPEDPSLYTLRLNADGTVNMRLNCNRANGTWSAEPGADPSNGSFRFGPLAMTRALCPPPSMDEQIASQSQYIRGYLLRNGRLHLSLMADGGIYSWEPMDEVPFQTEPDPAIEAAILAASPDYTQEAVESMGETGRARYLYSRVDLNGDDRDEVLAYPLGSIFCGTGGCNLLLFTETEGGLSLVNDFPISRTPVVVSPEKTEGWNDLFRAESGGERPPRTCAMPSTAPATWRGSACRRSRPPRARPSSPASSPSRTAFPSRHGGEGRHRGAAAPSGRRGRAPTPRAGPAPARSPADRPGCSPPGCARG